MLYITIGDKQVQWHVGEELPVIYSRVVKFQADGDELELILSTCRETNIKKIMQAEEELFPGTLTPHSECDPREGCGVQSLFSSDAMYEIRRLARVVAREEIRDAERRGREYYLSRGRGSV